MGIKDLNRFIRENCSEESIKRIHLQELSGKKIAVDTSIYLYKYAGENTLIESMYILLALFRQYNIIPVFVFEGKTPEEKKELLKKRKTCKQEAEKEYKRLKSILESDDCQDSTKQELLTNIDLLKKQFVYIRKEQIVNIKKMIRSFGMTYYDAPREADELCAALVIKKKVWGCLSEDTDMFVYGCSRVLRYLSLFNHNVVVYNTKNILEELGLSQEEFRKICVLSGRDYNSTIDGEDEHNLMNTLKLFKKYKKAIRKKECIAINDFYVWLIENTSYIQNLDVVLNVCDLFDFQSDKHELIDVFNNVKIMNGPLDIESIKPILIEDGFIF
uniref:XPG N-terminal domain-containing protein n=1 Tax=viral metagenome TaxID=1070528 RepID=A0A6C0KXT5_9ZZZZ